MGKHFQMEGIVQAMSSERIHEREFILTRMVARTYVR